MHTTVEKEKLTMTKYFIEGKENLRRDYVQLRKDNLNMTRRYARKRR
jgi:hypothetical protein